jgi:Phosphotransferase enzyme family
MNNLTTNYNFPDIISHFKTDEGTYHVKPFGSGHINDTFIARHSHNPTSVYLLQKINHFVFKDIAGLLGNMISVTNHLKSKIAKLPGGNPNKEVLTLIEGRDGKYYYADEDGNYWRMTCFLENTRSYDLVTTGQQAYQGGMAYGKFQCLLSDLNPDSIVDAIPNFLNIEKRLIGFNNAIDNDRVGRLKAALFEVEFLISRAAAMKDILRLGNAGILPLRITHNDTKFNNILFDENNEVQCVIDLDTVMPGYVAYDFGDAIRTIINTAMEDEANLDAIQLNIPLFTGFTRGYLSQTHSFLTEAELSSLMSGVLLMPYMQSIRFLTDYLEGDVYYKTSSVEHNLQRARAQMQLFKLLEDNKKKLTDTVNNEWLHLKNNLHPEGTSFGK